MIKITFAGVGLHITDSGLLGIKMDEKGQRSLGGKLALWAFYAFCFYFIWMMVRFFWVVSDIQAPPGAAADWSMATTSGQWLSALLGAGVLGAVGMLPGAIAWYTRPRED